MFTLIRFNGWEKLHKASLLGTARILRKIVDCNNETGGTRICWVGYEKEKVNETKYLRQKKRDRRHVAAW